MKKKLLLVSTVPETFATILKFQPRFLNEFFFVSIATSPGDEIESIKAAEGVSVHLVRMRRGISFLQDCYSLVKMILLILRIRPDAVHSYTPKAGLIAMLASRLCFVPVRIHTFTGLVFPAHVGFKKALLIAVDKLICSCATKIVPEGLGVKKDLIQFSITKKELNIIGYGNIAGVNTDYFSPDTLGLDAAVKDIQYRANLNTESFVFCFVGRLNADKGIRELAYAFESLPKNVRLIVVGAVDHTAPVPLDIMNQLKRDSRVYFIGFQDDIRPALKCSDILVLPSYREGFPNVILQAGAMALPVIATDINGCNEIIEPEVNGWLVPVKDVERLRDAMLNSITFPRTQQELMGKNARLLVQKRFEQKAHLQRMREFYSKELSQ